MNRTLKKAFEAASQLPDKKQKALGQVILDEIATDEQWDETFANSQGFLERLADEALAERRAGKTKPLTLETFE